MATTTNFGWETPDDTDLVKDGAAAIRTALGGVDTSFVDLKGGTTGQILSKASNTDLDYTWVTTDDANAIQNAIVDAKGDLIGATAADTPARLAVGTNGQVLTADSTAATGLAWATASAGSSNVAGKNGVINSNFSIWQRGTSFATSNTQYTADRWMSYISPSGSPVFTYSRQLTNDTTNLPFIQYCMRIQRTSGQTFTSQMFLAQDFETVNSIPYAGKTVTMSFYARKGANYSAASDALSYSVITGTGTDQNNFTAGYTGAATPLSGTATLTTTWQRFSTTATLASTATELELRFNWTPSGTAGAADYAEITGVQLEIASAATAYSPNSGTFQGELAACQRYYFRLGGNLVYQVLGGGTANGTTQCDVQTPLPVSMRVSPSSVDYSTVALQQKGGSPLNAVTSVTLGLQSPSLANTSFNVASGLTDGAWHRLMTNNSTSAYLAYNAEL